MFVLPRDRFVAGLRMSRGASQAPAGVLCAGQQTQGRARHFDYRDSASDCHEVLINTPSPASRRSIS